MPDQPPPAGHFWPDDPGPGHGWPDDPERDLRYRQICGERYAQGVSPELTDAQMDFIGAVIYSDLRRRRREARERGE